MHQLFEIQAILLKQFSHQEIYHRKIFDQFYFDNRINCLVGSRGVGKTTFLLEYVKQQGALDNRALYVSADNLFFLTRNFLDLVDALYKETDVRVLCIDEIHKQSNWQQQIKNIADIYLDMKIIFTGSSQVDLLQSRYDLSRRVTVYHLHGLSFREYLEMKYQTSFPVMTLAEMVESPERAMANIQLPQPIQDFHRYLQVGYYPFFNIFRDDMEKYQAIHNITQKVIYEDIALLHSLKTGTLVVIENLYKFILTSAPGEVNAYKLSSNLQKDFDSISNYLMYLRDAGLIRFLVSNKSGQSYLRNPEKMYPDNSNLLYTAYLNTANDNLLGKSRETFTLNQLQNANYPVFFTDQGDFECQGIILEVGGKNKSEDQIKHLKNAYVFSDGILSHTKKKLPLYWLGFLS